MFSDFLSRLEFSVIREKGAVFTARGNASVMSALVKFWGQRWATDRELCHLALKLQHCIWYQARCSHRYSAWQKTVRHLYSVWINKRIIRCLSFSALLSNSDQLFVISLRKKNSGRVFYPIYVISSSIFHHCASCTHGRGAKAYPSSPQAIVKETLKQLLPHHMDQRLRVACESPDVAELGKHGNIRTWPH